MNTEANARAFRFSAFAVIGLVVYIGVLAWRLVTKLASTNFCSTLVGAKNVAKATGVADGVVNACALLFRQQNSSLGWVSIILIVGMVLSLIVLVVLVIAGGKLTFSANKGGVSADMGRDAADAADRVAGAAQDAAEQVKDGQ